MEIEIAKKDRNLIVTITGEIDHHITEAVREKVDREFKRKNAKNIIFSFVGVNFMDSSGIGMVIGRYKSIEPLGGQVVVCNVSESVDRIFSMSGLYKIIKKCGDVNEALNLV